MVAAYAPAVYGVCRSLAEPEVADDLAHASFARAFASLGEFRAEGSPREWLLGIAVACCAAHVTQQAAAADGAARLAALPAPAQRHPDYAADAEACRDAFDALEPAARTAAGLAATGLFSAAHAAALLCLDEPRYRRLLCGALDAISAWLAPLGASRVTCGADEDPEAAYPALLAALRGLRWRPGAALQRRLDVLAAAL
jgi:DNA-directed RNA polymerase specialized sigma24 family protein